MSFISGVQQKRDCVCELHNDFRLAVYQNHGSARFFAGSSARCGYGNTAHFDHGCRRVNRESIYQNSIHYLLSIKRYLFDRTIVMLRWPSALSVFSRATKRREQMEHTSSGLLYQGVPNNRKEKKYIFFVWTVGSVLFFVKYLLKMF